MLPFLTLVVGVVASAASNLRVLPLAVDDWNTGHELPDVVDGRLFGNIVFMRVQTLAGWEANTSVRMHVEAGEYLEASSSEAAWLQPGQRSSLHAPLLQVAGMSVPAAACPLRVRLRVETGDDGKVLAGKEYQLLCRGIADRITFVYLDADGSPQIAAAKFPSVSPKTNRSACPKRGCSVLLSTHGMDVTAQRQADCYRPKQGAWVLAPHGRGTHGYNWQGPGHWSAIHALRALSERAKAWTAAHVALTTDRHRVVVSGHSNGGFGAWFFGTHYPDMTMGVAPLAGMATLGTTELRSPDLLNVDPTLLNLISSSVEEYRGDGLAWNLVGKPFVARAGYDDRVIDPRSTHRMCAELLSATGVFWEIKETKHFRKLEAWHPLGVDAMCVLFHGKEHWWW